LKKSYSFPWFTTLLTLVCLAIFIIFQIYKQSETPLFKAYSELGAPYAIQIYHGQHWGVITNSFIHINYTHIILNFAGLWLFGAFLERRMGFVRLFLLGLLGSIVTSSLQLGLTNDAGLGLSGVNLLLLGFILGKSLTNDEYKLKYRYLILFLAITGLCISLYLNLYHGYFISLEAMTGGLIIGYLLGLSSNFKSKVSISIAVILLITCSWGSLLYAPWSAEWNYSMAYTAHDNGEIENAKKYYNEAIRINPKHSISKVNLRLIKIDELSEKALKAHQEEDYTLARSYYEKLLIIDPKNKWAKENIRKLP